MRITALLLALALCTVAAPTRTYAGASGTILITPEQVDTSSGDWESAAKKAQAKTLEAKDGQWTLYFVAYLKKAAGADEVNVVFYDTAEKSHEPTNAFPIQTKSNAKVLVSSVAVSGDQGFKAGHTYNVLITRLVGGKEDVYAKSTIALK